MENRLKVMRGENVLLDETLNDDEFIEVSEDPGVNLDPKTGIMPTDESGAPLGPTPSVMTVHITAEEMGGALKITVPDPKAEVEPVEEEKAEEPKPRATRKSTAKSTTSRKKA